MNDDQTFLPHDIALEQCALGTAMLSPDAVGPLVDGLHADDFFRPLHQAVFTAIKGLSDRGEPVNPVTVRSEAGKLQPPNAAPIDALYVNDLAANVPLVGSLDFCIGKIRRFALLRRIEQASASIATTVRSASVDDAEHVVETAQKILDEATRTASPSDVKSVADLITGFMDMLEAGGDQRGVTTGWVDVDNHLIRLRPGQLITVAGRPGMGKSVAMANIAYHVGVTLGLPVYVSTLEMSTNEFMGRLVAYDAKVNLRHILHPQELTEDDWGRLSRSHARMSAAETLFIDDDPHLGIGRIRSKLRSMRRSGRPAELVVIDYLQLMEMAGKSENRQMEVSQISRSLKLLAKEFEVPVVIGSQLNRNVEQRADKRPNSADLRESGSIEQDSDVVILLYRDDHYDPESPHAGEVDFLIDKNRLGPRGTVTLAFQGHYSRIGNLAKPEWSPTAGMS